MRTAEKQNTPTKIIFVLCSALLLSWGFLLWHHNDQQQRVKAVVAQLQTTREARQQLTQHYDASLLALDSLSGQVSAQESILMTQNGRIAALKKQIDQLLHNDALSDQDNQRAALLIGRLNVQIADLYKRIRDLRADNQVLAAQRNTLVDEKEQYRKLKDILQQEVDVLAAKTTIGATLTTDSLYIRLLKVRKGGADRPVKNVHRADKFLLSFDVFNRIIEAGKTDICILLTDPDGRVVPLPESAGSGEIAASGEAFSAVLPVDIQPGIEKRIEVAWFKPRDIKKGDYNLTVYHNGLKIAGTVVHFS
jgi:cell division protein FtsB